MSNIVSVIIPSRKEIFLNKTIMDLLQKARGEIEIIPVLEGYEPDEVIENPKVRYIRHQEPKGLRACINAAAAIAKGDYLMKSDAHCLFDEGFDEKLRADCAENWVVIPSRYSLDAENWKVEMNRKPYKRDYHFLCYPDPNKDHDGGMHGVEWWARDTERSDPKYDIDDNMSFQGSCWFMPKKWFYHFGGMEHEAEYGRWAQEPTEISLKTWLGGGAVKVNKKTWYAHFHKGKKYRQLAGENNFYQSFMDDKENIRGHNWGAKYWMNNSWPGQIYPVDWVIEKFWPIPTWPDDWKQRLTKEGVIQL